VVCSGKAVPRCIISSDDIVKHAPRDSEGNLTSIGTIPHYLLPLGEQCKPCVFWFQELCRKGVSCLHCHSLHDGQKVKKIRPCKATRALRSRAKAIIAVWVCGWADNTHFRSLAHWLCTLRIAFITNRWSQRRFCEVGLPAMPCQYQYQSQVHILS